VLVLAQWLEKGKTMLAAATWIEEQSRNTASCSGEIILRCLFLVIVICAGLSLQLSFMSLWGCGLVRGAKKM
jgi:hypothetical protein